MSYPYRIRIYKNASCTHARHYGVLLHYYYYYYCSYALMCLMDSWVRQKNTIKISGAEKKTVVIPIIILWLYMKMKMMPSKKARKRALHDSFFLFSF